MSSTEGAVVVSVGDELLLGETVNGNLAWLGRRLTRLGLPVRAGYTVADDEAWIRRAVATGLDQSRVVVVTGGLGPTPDDLTKEAVAGLLGLEIQLRQDLLDALDARFREWGYDELPPANRSQAEVPEGARCLRNPRGTAPGIVLEVTGGRQLVVLLPGVPAEMRGIFEEELEDVLRAELGEGLRPTRHRTLHTTGVPESVLADVVPAALPEDTGPVTVAFLPGVTGVDLRLSAREVASDVEAEEWLDRVEEALTPALERYRYQSPRGDLVDAVAEVLERRGWSLAVAESCTGGLVAERLTARPGASAWFLGGVVSYSDESKVRDLGVERGILEAEGAVSEAVVRAMVEGVTSRFGADAGIALTGIAGPGGGSAEKPVGTVWYAVSAGGEVRALRTRFPGDRRQVRERSAQAALHLLLRRIEEP